MYPVLFNIGPLPVRGYGFAIAMGLLVCIFFSRKEAVRVGENPDLLMDLAFYTIIAGLIGSRLFYLFNDMDYFIKNPLNIFKVWEGGLVFYGAAIGAGITGFYYLKKNDMKLWKTVDIAAPFLPLAHAIARIGCLLAGCCYGAICDLPWAITFHDKLSIAPTEVALHPTQIYSTLSNFTIFIFLYWFRKKKKFEGQVFWIYVLIYSVARSFVEMFRGDPRGTWGFGPLSVSQSVGVIMFINNCLCINFYGTTHSYAR